MIDKLLTAKTGWLAHMDGWDTDASGWVMMIGMVLFWALIVVAIVWLVRSAPWGGHHHRPDSPLEMLDRRFASGEITADEYRERRSVLQGQPPSGG